MKGVSAVIAVILILMIVVALAALAYTWFTGIFSTLTTTTGTAVEQATGAMGQSFTLENADCEAASVVCGGNDCVHVTIRNTGTNPLDTGAVATYVDGLIVTDNAPVGSIVSGATVDLDAGTGAGEVDCLTAVILEVTIGTGLSQTVAIT